MSSRICIVNYCALSQRVPLVQVDQVVGTNRLDDKSQNLQHPPASSSIPALALEKLSTRSRANSGVVIKWKSNLHKSAQHCNKASTRGQKFLEDCHVMS